ncbi:YeeE/YedE thiosulfate transporter family protein [Psychromonas sp. MME2]|uniref:YeeE/YedE family protein n=1 Tax=unclassified Psychromonas TaxID=2614957 RepID=UPI00339C0371
MNFNIPWESFIGGALLGLSAAVLMLFSGKVAGISGVIGGLLKPQQHDSSWRIAFLCGMAISFVVVAPFGFSLPDISHTNIIVMCLGGLLVGFGSRLGNGCTSGHGIIGLGRFSKRSIYATSTFMASAMIVVFLRKQFGVL